MADDKCIHVGAQAQKKHALDLQRCVFTHCSSGEEQIPTFACPVSTPSQAGLQNKS